ncbi:MAG: TonB-dependent receptor [Syntrophaceae bacterium]|nr:TonB-dependent receptor [Syntrophaceae bacterium]
MKRFVLLITLFMLLISIPLSLPAQEKEVTLEPVVVTAIRDVQEIRKVPANVTMITREEIERSNAKTAVDLLRSEVGVTVRDFTGNGKTASVDIRGFGETGPLNTLVLVDGRRVNEIDLSGVDWTQIPVEQIERIEILRGSGSVLYGDNAVGGVINIITRKPEKPLSFRTEVTRGSYLYHKESGSVSGKWGPLSAIFYGGYSSSEGYRENGFLRYKDVGGKIFYDLSDAVQFSFTGNFHRDDSGFPGALSKLLYELDRRTTTKPDDKAETDDGFLTFGVKANLGNMGRFETDLSWRHREVTNSFLSSLPTSSFKDRRNLTTWGWAPKYILEKTLVGHFNKIICGLDYYHSGSKIDSESYFFGSTTYDGIETTKKSSGLYLLDEFSIFENLILSLGGRWEWVTYDISQDLTGVKDRKRDSEPAWNVGLNYLFAKGSSAFISIKRSFRFPVTDELTQYVFRPPDFQPEIQINPAMKPQTGYHYEAGVRYLFKDWMEGNLTLFWIDLKNEIFYNPDTFTNENAEKTRRQGVEVGLRVKPLEWLNLWGNYGYIRPLMRGGAFSGNDIPNVPRHKGSIGADLNFEKIFLNEYLKGFSINGRANFIGSRRFISDWANQVEKLDPYYTFDAKLSYSWKGLKAFVGVNNITNQKYAEYGVLNFLKQPYYYPSPERNFFGGISYTF